MRVKPAAPLLRWRQGGRGKGYCTACLALVLTLLFHNAHAAMQLDRTRLVVNEAEGSATLQVYSEDRLPLRQALPRAWLALLMPIIILGGIYGGIFTPTEASAIAVVYAWIVGTFVYRRLNFKLLSHTLQRTVVSTAVIMFIIANAGVFGFLLNRAGVPAALGEWLGQLFSDKAMFLLGINVALFCIGMFIETSASIVVLAPLLLPVALQFGVDPAHFGIVMVVNLALGMVTPPFGVNLFAACTVAKVRIEHMIRPLLPFVLVVLGCLLMITYVPAISLTLRDLAY